MSEYIAVLVVQHRSKPDQTALKNKDGKIGFFLHPHLCPGMSVDRWIPVLSEQIVSHDSHFVFRNLDVAVPGVSYERYSLGWASPEEAIEWAENARHERAAAIREHEMMQQRAYERRKQELDAMVHQYAPIGQTAVWDIYAVEPRVGFDCNAFCKLLGRDPRGYMNSMITVERLSYMRSTVKDVPAWAATIVLVARSCD